MYDVEVLKTSFWNVRRTRAFEGMAAQVRAVREKYSTTPVEGIVVFGSGGFRSEDKDEDEGEEIRMESLRQVATISALAQELGLQKHGPKTAAGDARVRICVDARRGDGQRGEDDDGRLSEVEVDFLISLGFVCVDEKEAYASVTEQTLVYAVGAGPQTFAELSKGTWPAAIISEDVERVIRSARRRGAPYTHGQRMDVRGMVKGCDGQPFAAASTSRDEDGPGEVLYWRRSPVLASQHSHRNSAERFLEFMSTIDPPDEGNPDGGRDLSANSADDFFRSVILNPQDVGSKSNFTREVTQPTSPSATSPTKEKDARSLDLQSMNDGKPREHSLDDERVRRG